MLIEKLAAGVVRVQTPIGPRYVMPSFLQRLYLLWVFRNFAILPHAVLSRTAAAHDRSNVQRAAFCLDGIRRGHGRSSGHRNDRASTAAGAGFFAAPPSGSAGIFAWGRSASAPVISLTAPKKGVRSCGGGLGPPHLAPDVCSVISYTTFLC